MPRAHLFVKGSVQGVGFRFFASRTANYLGLKGFVRNIPDGGVEIIAEGPAEKLAELIRLIEDGPITASVNKVEVKWEKETGEFKSFGIEY